MKWKTARNKPEISSSDLAIFYAIAVPLALILGAAVALWL